MRTAAGLDPSPCPRREPFLWRTAPAPESSAISLLGCLGTSADLAELLAEAARVPAPGGTLCLSAMNRQSRLRLGSGGFTAYDPAALAVSVQQAGFLLEEQIFYGHFLAAGRLVLPRPAAARRLERDATPGSRDPWARQILLLARRDV